MAIVDPQSIRVPCSARAARHRTGRLAFRAGWMLSGLEPSPVYRSKAGPLDVSALGSVVSSSDSDSLLDGEDGSSCKVAVAAVGAMLPGHIDAFPVETVGFEIVNYLFGYTPEAC